MEVHPDFFIKGIMIGFAIAAPVGPIGVLCIRRTLLNGVVSGLASGTGAALADCLYGTIAAFSLTAVAAFLQEYAIGLQVLGGFFLVALGARLARQKPHKHDEINAVRTEPHSAKEIAGDLLSTFLLTLTNPATILSFVAIFAGLGLVNETGKTDYNISALMVAGVFSGSFLWWCLLSGGIGIFRHKLDRKALRFTNILSGIIIGGFGAVVLSHAVAHFM